MKENINICIIHNFVMYLQDSQQSIIRSIDNCSPIDAIKAKCLTND